MSAGSPNDGGLNAFLARDGWLPHVTSGAVAEALNGFPLPSPYSADWLATAVRRALAATMRHASEGPQRQSNSATRKELNKLASRAADLWREIFECSTEADSALWDFAWKRWKGEGGQEIGGVIVGVPSDFEDFRDAVARLDGLAAFLREAAASIPNQRPRWTENERREIRIDRAHFLMPVFQSAFGIGTLAGFGDFYQRMVSLAFEEGDIPDFEALISEARRRHLEAPATLPEGVVPEPS